MSTHHVDLSLSLDLGAPVRVMRCRVEEGASLLTHAVVEVASRDDVDFGAVRAADATLEIATAGGVSRSFRLCAGALRFKGVVDGTLRHDLHLHAHPWLLTHTKNTRKFQKQSAKEIIASVLSAHGVPFTFRLSQEPEARDYCVQYAESDLAFVSRLLEFEGIFYSFEPDGTMVMADRSSAAPPVAGASSHFELIDAAGALGHAEVGVLAIARTARVTSGKASVNDHNWKTPSLPLLASSAADRDAELETYEYPAGFRDPGAGAAIAQRRLEAHRAGASFVEGEANTPEFAAGKCFSFGDRGGRAYAGDYFLTSVTHEAEAPVQAGARETGSYRSTFRAIARGVPFRPAMSTPRPTIAGSHTAMVRGPAGSEIHTDEHGRLRAQFHWDREAKGTDQDSRWIRMLQETSTSVGLARVGWEVDVAYVDGDPDRPVGIARKINGEMVPSYAQPANKNMMTIKTPSSPATGGFSELKLDDSAGSMLFHMKAEKDLSAMVKHDEGWTIGNDERMLVGRDAAEKVTGDRTSTVGRDRHEAVDGNRSITVDGDRTKTIAGSEKVKVKGEVSLTTNGDEREKVGTLRLTIAGGLTMPNFLERAKRAVTGLVPNPKAIAQGAASAALSGAQSGAMGGFESGGGLGNLGGGLSGAASGAMSGALSGGMQSLSGSLTNLIPNPSGLASQVTGGLSNGINLDTIANNFFTGSISRSASKKLARTIGAAFISVAAKDISASSSKIYLETIGGVKLSAVGGGISENVDGMLAVTVGGAIIRKSQKDMVSSTKNATGLVGGALSLASDKEVYLTADTIEVTALSKLAIEVGGAKLELTSGSVAMGGDVLAKATESAAFRANTQNFIEV